MTMTCAEVREMLPAYVDDGPDTLIVRRHLARCANCRAELATYTELKQGLRSLEPVPFDAPAGLKRALVAIPTRGGRVGEVRTHVARNRRAYLGGAAILVAGAAGAAVWRTRGRHATA